MIVETSAGAIIGREVSVGDRRVLRFGGVPYAASPTGVLRFAPPQPVERWSGVRDCTTPGPGAPQIRRAVGVVPDSFPATTTEDCLTAEIFTTDVDSTAPVLVWVPGGRYQIGAAGLATYDGSLLAAEHGLVVVGLNYRLGAMGFSPVEGYYNNGLRDLIAALGWIRDNIDRFGGDPTRITLMGESAGAGCIAHLLASPLLDVDVHGAIIQSASPGSTLPRSVGEKVHATLLELAGADLTTMPVDELIDLQEAVSLRLMGSVGMMPFHPVIDDEVLTRNPLDVARAGDLHRCPLIVGTTDDEMELFRDAVPALPPDVAIKFIARKLQPLLPGEDVDRAAEKMIANHGGDLVQVVAEVELHLPARILADGAVRAGLDAWRYRFGWKSPGMGAFHALDLPFIFGTLDVEQWRDVAGAHRPEADRLSAQMRQAWASFASSGSVQNWVRHDPAHPEMTWLGDEIRNIPG